MDSNIRCALTALAALCVSSSAFAITNVTPTDLSGLTSDSVSALVQTVGIVGDFRSYMPATPLGMLLGFDVGIDMTYLSLPSTFASALALASGQSTSQLPSGFVLPKINVHKGLPYGLDVGASFITTSDAGQTVYSSYGGDIKWAFLNKPLIPVVAFRASFTSDTIYFLNAHTYTFDVVASKDLFILDPYVGAGLQMWSGSISVPSTIPQLPSGVSTDASGTNAHMYAGAMFKLVIFRFVAQVDYSTAGFTTFGGKFSVGF